MGVCGVNRTCDVQGLDGTGGGSVVYNGPPPEREGGV